jgi:hypothetical protein
MRMSIDPWIPGTTCTTVLATVSEVLQSSDFDIMIWPQRTKEQREPLWNLAQPPSHLSVAKDFHSNAIPQISRTVSAYTRDQRRPPKSCQGNDGDARSSAIHSASYGNDNGPNHTCCVGQITTSLRRRGRSRILRR